MRGNKEKAIFGSNNMHMDKNQGADIWKFYKYIFKSKCWSKFLQKLRPQNVRTCFEKRKKRVKDFPSQITIAGALSRSHIFYLCEVESE
jgi:hypothetical protein